MYTWYISSHIIGHGLCVGYNPRAIWHAHHSSCRTSCMLEVTMINYENSELKSTKVESAFLLDTLW